ncbi:MAG: c-type cytochrome [Pseudomonadota bacterium]
MSQTERDSGHQSPIKTPKQLITVIALAFLVPILIITLLSWYVANFRSINMDSPAMSNEAVTKRLRPVGELTLAEVDLSATAVAREPDGKKVYDTTCAACHGAGVAGAPKTGDKSAWAPRLKSGMKALYASALKGKGAMPPKGGNAALTDAEVKAAVDYLAGRAK